MKFKQIDELIVEDILKGYTGDTRKALEELCNVTVNNFLYESSSNIRIIKNPIKQRFISEKGFDFRGIKLNSNQDLAALAKIVRDTRYETFRIMFMRGDTVVGVESISSRLIGATMTVNMRAYKADNQVTRMMAEMKAKMNRLNADGYYLMHNHPSGSVKMSKEDIIVTSTYANNLNGFLGHIIVGVDSGSIFKFNSDGYLEMTSNFTLDGADKIDGYFEIHDRDDFEKYAYELTYGDNYSVIIFADNNLTVIETQEIHNSVFNDINFLKWLEKERTSTGGSNVFLVTNSMRVAEIGLGGKSFGLINDVILFKNGNPTFYEVSGEYVPDKDFKDWLDKRDRRIYKEEKDR